MALSREAILARAQAFETREVHIPSWADESGDDVVLVRGLSAKEWDAHQASVRIFQGGQEVGIDQNNVSAKLVVRCIVDESGKRLLTDADAAVLGDLPITDLNTIMEAILDLSGMTEKAQGEVEGNSDAAQSGEQSSDSPESTDEPPTSS